MENQVMKALLERRSCRKYKSDPVPDGLLDQITAAGLNAASGRGRQSAIIIQVTNKTLRDQLSKLNGEIMGTTSDPFYGAPAVLIVLADKNVPTYLYDGSLVIGNMLTAAESLGLGACWIHRAKQEFEQPEGKAILKRLGIEGDYEGIGHCIVGYRDDDPKDIPRNPGRLFKID
jgi:nitroreductase